MGPVVALAPASPRLRRVRYAALLCRLTERTGPLLEAVSAYETEMLAYGFAEVERSRRGQARSAVIVATPSGQDQNHLPVTRRNPVNRSRDVPGNTAAKPTAKAVNASGA